MPLHAGRLTREEPLRRIHELERARDLSVKFLGQLQLVAGDDDKSAGEAIEV
jgi:hypothetical protein